MRESLPFIFWSRPFVGVAAVLMAGIVAGRFLGVELPWCLVGLGVAAVMVVWRRTRWPGLLMGIFVLGMALYVVRYRVESVDDLRMVLTGEPELVTVRGRLADSPSVREFQAGKSEVAYSYATLDVAAIRKGKEEWRSAKGRIATRLRGELAEGFFKGRRVEVTGVIAYPTKAAAPGLFDYRAYLHNTRIFFQLKSDSTNDWQLMSFERMPVTERFQRWAEVQLTRGLPERDEASEIIAAMTLGQRNTLSGEMADVFMRTGTMHIIAISGLHVACITTFLCIVLLNGLGLSRGTGGLVVLALVWFYTVATGLQSSAVRSALMASVFIMGWVLRRPGNLMNTLAVSSVLILAVQPEQIFQTSFQLSFSVVLAIALMLMLVESQYPTGSADFRRIVLQLDPLLPHELAPRWKICAQWVLGIAIGNLAISTASWIGSMPLTAYYFNTVTPVSLLANLLAVPLSSISLGATVISILAVPIAPVSNYIAWIFMHATIDVVEFFGRFPFGYFYVNYTNTSHELTYKSHLGAARVARYVYLHRDLWQYQAPRIAELIELDEADGENYALSVRDETGAIV
ncbi:MAG: ComEC/Rec2 family competence protein, partial [Limisphaerales bacterium]